MKRKLAVLANILLPLLLLFPLVEPALAEIQIIVEGNGDDSSNSVQADSSQTTTVNQSNTASVDNNIAQSADTGGNTTSGNTGQEVQLSTGDVSTTTTVDNNFNHSTVTAPCCQTGFTTDISGNGTNSTNTVNFNNNISTNVNLNQVANANNEIGITAFTGNNTANGNLANVNIKTGSIYGGIDLFNQANFSTVLTTNGGAGDVVIKVTGNGEASINNIILSLQSTVNIWKNELVNINNKIYTDLVTGGNLANGNLGDVLLQTGDINFDIDVTNGPINNNSVEVLCCEDGEVVPPPTPPKPPEDRTAPPPPPPPTGGNGGSSQQNIGQVLAAVTDILPATGASAIHFWIMAVVYLLTFLSGLYLRLRAGRSPDYLGYKLLSL